MRISVSCVMVALVFSACSGPSEPDRGNDGPAPNAAPDAPAEDMMANIDMQLWPLDEVPQAGQKPLLTIKASRFFPSAASDDEWRFEDAVAWAPAQREGQADIHFEANSGLFHEGKWARLEGEVKAWMNDMTIELEDIVWEIGDESSTDQPGGRAYSDHPITIESPTQQLEATSLKLDPKTSEFELTDVSGEIHFGGMTP